MTIAEADPAPAAEFRPVSLADVPEVNLFLEVLGDGPFAEGTVRSPMGRNDVWSGVTASGRGVFVKRLSGPHIAERLMRIATLDTLIADHAADSIRTPRLLGVDPDKHLVAHERIGGVSGGGQPGQAEEHFTARLCAQAARLIAALHALPATDFDNSDHPFPPTKQQLRGLPLSLRQTASSGELAMWRVIQTDAGLAEAFDVLRGSADSFRDAICHADLRLDQFLIDGDELYLTDFEDARVSDPARDTGAFIGQWVYQAVVSIPDAANADNPFGATLTHEQVLTAGTAILERLQPRMSAFWTAYLDAASPADAPGLAIRTASWAGWHLFELALSSSLRTADVPALPRAAAGIGRVILDNPDAAITALALETS